MRRFTTTLSFAAAIALTTGCGTFYETDDYNGLDQVTFDETMPDALDDLFATCADPIVLDDSTTEIDLLAGCPEASPEFTADGAGLLHWGMANGYAASSFDLDGSLFPTEMEPMLTAEHTVSLTDEAIEAMCVVACEDACTELLPAFMDATCENCTSTCEDENDVPWPVDTCVVDIAFDLEFGEIEMAGLDAEWTSYGADDLAALDVDFDFRPMYLSDYMPGVDAEDDVFVSYSDAIVLARGDITSDVTCDLHWSWVFLQIATFGIVDVEQWVENAILDRLPDGVYEIALEDVDMDLWFTLEHDTTTVDAEFADVTFTAGSIDLRPGLDPDLEAMVGSFEDLLSDISSSAGGSALTANNLASDIEDDLWTSLASSGAGDEMADGLATLIEDPIEDDQQICSLREDDGEIKMTLDDLDGACLLTFGGGLPDGFDSPTGNGGPQVYVGGPVPVDLVSAETYQVLQAQQFDDVHHDMVEALLSMPPRGPIVDLPLPPFPVGSSAEDISQAFYNCPAYLATYDAFMAGSISYATYLQASTELTQSFVEVVR